MEDPMRMYINIKTNTLAAMRNLPYRSLPHALITYIFTASVIMAETLAFRSALARIGFQPPLQDAIVAQGITSLVDLLMFQKDQIKRLCKVIRERAVDPLEINMRQKQLLETMRFWAQARVRANLPLNAALFTLALAQTEAMKMVSALEETAEKEPDVKMPDKFKLTSKWIVFI
jgi:hypothetical protein